MADPVDEVQAIGAARRSPVLGLPVEAPSAAGAFGPDQEEIPRRVAPAGEGGETQDLVAMTTLRERVKQLVTQLSPIRVSFLIDRESRNVRIRVIDVRSGEIIREVPPGDVLKPKPPTERF